MKRREDVLVEQEIVEEAPQKEKIEPTEEGEKVVSTDNESFKVVNNKMVDEEGFAVSDSSIETNEELSPLFVEVDRIRENYVKSVKKFKYINWAVMFAILVGIIVTFIFINSASQTMQIVLIVLIVVLLAGVLVYNYLVKRYLRGKGAHYVSKYYELTTRDMMSGPDFSDVTINPKGKVEKGFFSAARFYQHIQGVGSRNLCTFNYKGHAYDFVDLAAQIQGVKKLEPIFIGKVLKHTLEKPVNGRILIQIKGNSKLTKPVNDIEGLEEIEKTNNYVVYSNMKKVNKFVTKTITDAFGRYKINNDLLDVIISVNEKTIAIGLDLNDHVMELPTDRQYKKALTDDIKAALLNSLDIAENMIKAVE